MGSALVVFHPLLEFNAIDGMIMTCTSLNLVILASLESSYYRHYPPAGAFWAILQSICCVLWTRFSNISLQPRLFTSYLLSFAGSALRIYQLRYCFIGSTTASIAASRASEFLEHRTDVSAQEKALLTEILCHDPPRNEGLYQEYRDGLLGKSREEQVIYARKFYAKYSVFTVSQPFK